MAVRWSIGEGTKQRVDRRPGESFALDPKGAVHTDYVWAPLMPRSTQIAERTNLGGMCIVT